MAWQTMGPNCTQSARHLDQFWSECGCGFRYDGRMNNSACEKAHTDHLAREEAKQNFGTVPNSTGKAWAISGEATIENGKITSLTHWLDGFCSSIEGNKGAVIWGK